MDKRSWTRRSVLAAGTAIVSTNLAGCTGGSSPTSGSADSGTGTTSKGGTGVFKAISFDGGSMVVRLQESHNVSQVNLIAPDGTGFAQADVPDGATTVRMKILDIEPMGADHEHYTPGVHKLTAVTGNSSRSMELDLRPEMSIVAVEQPRESNRGSRYGQVQVVVRNSGSAPTWVYGIVYRDAPNFAANDELNSNPGVPQLPGLDQPHDAIVGPAEERSFIGASPPLLFDDSEKESCAEKEYEFTVVVGTAVGTPEEARLQAITGGNVVSAGLTGEYTCSEASIQITDSGAPE